MEKKNCRVYCAAYGCLNSTLTHPEITFFKLPGHSERRVQWLKLIHRDDLVNKTNFSAYRICEKHFNVDDIRQSPNRKLLKKNTLPLLMQPSLANMPENPWKEDKQSQTEPSVQVDRSTQTENACTCTQTASNLSRKTPRKGQLLYNLLKSKKKRKPQEKEKKTQKAESRTFHGLYEEYLNSKQT